MTLSSFSRAWNRWWFRTGPPHLLALFRILFGGFLFVTFGIQLPYVSMLYSREGILLPLFEPIGPLTVMLAPPPAWAAMILFVVFLLSLLSFAAGLLTRVAAAVAMFLYIYYWCLTLFQFGTSFDRLFMFTLLVLVPSGCGKTFSVDMFFKHRSFFAWEPISVLPQRLIAVQITATYLGVGWQKLMLPAWQSGKVLVYGFMGRWATAPAWVIARWNLPLWFYDVSVWIIKVFELTIPFGLWFRRTRWWFFVMGALFHTGIAILLDIWWFLALIPSYIVFFEPEEVSALVDTCGGSFRKRTSVFGLCKAKKQYCD